MAKRKGTLENGFKFDIDDAVLDDMELIDDMAEAQGDNPLKISAVMNKVLGEEQKGRLYDHVRDEATGRVPVEKVSACLAEIFEKIGEEAKN